MNLFIFVKALTGYIVSICQLFALFIISIGIIKALWIYIRYSLFSFQSGIAFQQGRLEMGYSFSLGLSVLVGGSILKTTIAPTWNDIARLSATIAIRTVLNYFLLQAIDNSSKIVLTEDTVEVADLKFSTKS
ncbi:MAG: DUF1622 domain-containing protein [Microcoleaceae cyanobacterium]